MGGSEKLRNITHIIIISPGRNRINVLNNCNEIIYVDAPVYADELPSGVVARVLCRGVVESIFAEFLVRVTRCAPREKHAYPV